MTRVDDADWSPCPEFFRSDVDAAKVAIPMTGMQSVLSAPTCHLAM